MTKEYTLDEPIQPVFKAQQAFRCAINADGSQLGIIAKKGTRYQAKPCAGYLYDLRNLEDVPEPFLLEGTFQHASRLVFTSDSKYLVVMFNGEAFGSSPSICAYETQTATPAAWFISPLSDNFSRLAVPQTLSSKFVAVDAKGKIYVFDIEVPC